MVGILCCFRERGVAQKTDELRQFRDMIIARQLALSVAACGSRSALILLIKNCCISIPEMSLSVSLLGFVSETCEHAVQLRVCSPFLFTGLRPCRILDSKAHRTDPGCEPPGNPSRAPYFRIPGYLPRLCIRETDWGGMVRQKCCRAKFPLHNYI